MIPWIFWAYLLLFDRWDCTFNNNIEKANDLKYYNSFIKIIMNKPIPVVNRIVHKRETDRNNDLLMQKLNNVKVNTQHTQFANFTAFKIKH